MKKVKQIDFMEKHYPGIKRKMHKQRIINLSNLLDKEREEYEKKYKVNIVM